MRSWVKYEIVGSTDKVIKLAQDYSFSEHANAMGYYKENELGEDKTDFFNKFYYNYHSGRLLNYDKFLKKHIKKSDRVLSIASGRSANELKLLQEGYDITCSDLDKLPSYERTKNLFPEYNFFTLDILKQPAEDKFDSLVSLSLIYLFSDGQLDIFFSNLSKSCKENGSLILDSAGSPDNLLSYCIHNILLRYETYLIRFLRNLFQKKQYGLSVQDFGYRRNDIEIIEIAGKNGFEFIEQENFSFVTEFERSRILKRLIKIDFIRKIFTVIGKRIPYIRMFLFKKMKGESAHIS